MLEEMRKINAVGGVVANGPGEVAKFGEQVGGATGLAVQPHRPGLLLLLPASDVKGHRRKGGGFIWNRTLLETPVIPAEAGIQPVGGAFPSSCAVDSRFRGNDMCF